MNVTEHFFDLYYQRTLSISNTFINFIAILGNLWVLVTFVKHKALRLKECLYLIGGLAFMDFVTAAGSLVYNMNQVMISFGVIQNYTNGFCLMNGYGQLVGIKGCQLMTLAIAWDRFSAFRDYISYKNKQHEQYAKRCFLFSFLYAVLAPFTIFIGVKLYGKPRYCSLGGVMLPQWGMFWSLFVLTVSVSVLLLYCLSLIFMRKMHETLTANQDQALKRQIEITKTISTVVMFFAIFWVLPNIVFISCVFTKQSSIIIRARAGALVSLGSGLNCAVNVFVYAGKHGLLRPYMMATLKCKHSATIQPTANVVQVPHGETEM